MIGEYHVNGKEVDTEIRIETVEKVEQPFVLAVIEVGPVEVMQEGEERIEEDLKGIHAVAVVLVIDDARKGGQIGQDDKICTHYS